MVSASASQDTLRTTKKCASNVSLRAVSNVISKKCAVSVLHKRISRKIQSIKHASVLRITSRQRTNNHVQLAPNKFRVA